MDQKPFHEWRAEDHAMSRATNLLQQSRYPAVNAGHKHAEAFNLMWYKCEKCGHRERIWNSRDGVTPFCIDCPSCGDLSHHVDFGRDEFQPEHTPHRGQRIFVNITAVRAAIMATRRLAILAERHGASFTEEHHRQLAADIFGDGTQPMLAIHGYTEGDGK